MFLWTTRDWPCVWSIWLLGSWSFLLGCAHHVFSTMGNPLLGESKKAIISFFPCAWSKSKLRKYIITYNPTCTWMALHISLVTMHSMEWTTKYHFGWFVALFGTNLKPWVFFNKHWASDFPNLIIRRDTHWLVSKDQKFVWTNLEDSRNRSTWPMLKKKHLNFGSLVVGLFACHSGSPCMKCMSFTKIPCVHFFGSAAPQW